MSGPDAFVEACDPWGRPVALRLDAVALVEGALDADDPKGDLCLDRPLGPYRRLTLTNGARVYLDAHSADTVLDALRAS